MVLEIEAAGLKRFVVLLLFGVCSCIFGCFRSVVPTPTVWTNCATLKKRLPASNCRSRQASNCWCIPQLQTSHTAHGNIHRESRSQARGESSKKFHKARTAERCVAPAHMPLYMHWRRASPWPWKNRKDRKKSAMKISTSEMTTAEVVLSPTPLAPPVVVNPHAQLTCMHRPRIDGRLKASHLFAVGPLARLLEAVHAPHSGALLPARVALRRWRESSIHMPQARTTEMMTPNTQALIMDVTTSQVDTARAAESRMTLAGTPYTTCASVTLAAMPALAETACY